MRVLRVSQRILREEVGGGGRGAREGNLQTTPAGWAPRGSCRVALTQPENNRSADQKMPKGLKKPGVPTKPRGQDSHGSAGSRTAGLPALGCWEGGFTWPPGEGPGFALGVAGLADSGTRKLHRVRCSEKGEAPKVGPVASLRKHFSKFPLSKAKAGPLVPLPPRKGRPWVSEVGVVGGGNTC